MLNKTTFALAFGRATASGALAATISLSAFIPASAAFACGGIFDVACNVTHGGLSPGNIAKQTEKAGQDTANTVAKARAFLD